MNGEKEQFKPEKGIEFQERPRDWRRFEIDAEELPDLQPKLLFESPATKLRPPYSIPTLDLATFFENLSEDQKQQLAQEVEAGFGESGGLRKLKFIIKDLIGDIATEEPFLEGLYSEDDKPLRWYLNFDRDISAYFLQKYSANSEFFRKIYEAIGSPKLDKYARAEVEDRLDSMRDAREKLRGVKPEISRIRERIPPTNTEDTISVWVNGVSVGGDGAKKRYIETLFVQSCVAVSIWDPETKTGGIAHLPPWTDARKAIDEIVRRIERVQNRQGVMVWRLEARIVGGWQYFSEKIILDISDALESHNIQIVEKDILHPKYTFKDVVLDTRTGELFDIDREKIEIPDEYYEEFERTGDFWRIMRGISEYRALERDAKVGEPRPIYDFDPGGL